MGSGLGVCHLAAVAVGLWSHQALRQASGRQLALLQGQVQAVPTLAITLEPKGGVPGATGPTGPVLFTGALIRRDL